MTSKDRKILIIDDEESMRDACTQVLSRKGYQVECTGDALRGLAMALKDIYDVILLDVRMPKMDGLEILAKLKVERNISAKIIVVTGYGSIPIAVEAMREGAYNFLTKPYSAADLKKAVEDALKHDKGNAEKGLSLLNGTSDYMKELKEAINRIAQTDSTVLITGESGTGKELVARTIHNLSKGPISHSSLLTVPHSLKHSWKANYSDMSKGHSAALRSRVRVVSRWQIKEHYFLMRFPTSTSTFRPNCLG